MNKEEEFELELELKRIKEQEQIKMKASFWLVLAFGIIVVLFQIGNRTST